MDIHKETDRLKKIETRRILWDTDVIKIFPDGDIDIDGNNLPVPQNLPMTGQN